MMGSVTGRYARRTLTRNLRRTLLSLVGVAIGVGIGLVGLAWIRGEEDMSVRAAASGGIGHLRVAPDGWHERRDPDLRLAGGDEVLERARSTDGVETATPRARARALLGLGTRSAHVELTGVDPETEPRALRYVRELAEGRYLRPGDEGAVVLGRTLVDRLDARLDDELVVTIVDDEGEMRSALLRVVGIAETGSRGIDATIAHVVLADVERLSGREGPAEVTVLVGDLDRLEQVRAALADRIPEGNEVLTWLQVSPELRANLENDGVFMNLTIGIILLVVLLGVASAQLTGVLERRKEFAVLAALGMRGRQLIRVVLGEAFALGMGGAALALGWAGPLLHRLHTRGVDFSEAMGSEEGVTFGDVLIDPVFHPDFGLWLVPAALALALIATIVASLYPAWFAARTDPASALRVDR